MYNRKENKLIGIYIKRQRYAENYIIDENKSRGRSVLLTAIKRGNTYRPTKRKAQDRSTMVMIAIIINTNYNIFKSNLPVRHIQKPVFCPRLNLSFFVYKIYRHDIGLHNASVMLGTRDICKGVCL